MKVLLYTEALRFMRRSGLGRAIEHQKRALESVGIEYTTYIKAEDCDVVHINSYGPRSKALAKRAKKRGKRVVMHAHSTEEDFRNSFIGSNLFSGLFKKHICSCYRLGDIIITPTEYSKRLLTGYSLGKPITAISNGKDIKKYAPADTDRVRFRSRYGYTESDRVIISVGLYFERKGILDFVELAKRMPDCKFIWFGGLPLISVPHKVRKAVRTKLPNLIFAGYVEPAELKQAYVGCDVYIFPTYEETEGIVLLEALAAKANVIVRDIPVFDRLEDGKEVYKAGGTGEFEQKIRDIIGGRLPPLCENGYNAVLDKDISFIGERLKKAYLGEK